jgi:hypothetical protein
VGFCLPSLSLGAAPLSSTTRTRIRYLYLQNCFSHQPVARSYFTKVVIYTVDPRTSNGLMFEQLETRTKNSRKIRFCNSNKNSKVEQRITWSSRGRLLSLLGPDKIRVIHLPVNSNIPPNIIINWLLYNIFYVCTIINKNFQLFKLNILVLSLWSFQIGT